LENPLLFYHSEAVRFTEVRRRRGQRPDRVIQTEAILLSIGQQSDEAVNRTDGLLELAEFVIDPDVRDGRISHQGFKSQHARPGPVELVTRMPLDLVIEPLALVPEINRDALHLKWDSWDITTICRLLVSLSTKTRTRQPKRRIAGYGGGPAL